MWCSDLARKHRKMNPVFVNFSQNECNEVLRKKFRDGNYTITSYKFDPLHGLGFLGDHAFLKIRCVYSGEKKNLQFFTKAMCSEESQRTFVEEGGGFHKECSLFKQIVPEFLKNNIKIISDCVPICYVVHDMKYIIFEDLNTINYQTVSQRESMSLDCVHICLEALSKLHSSALINEEIETKRTGNTYKLIEKYPDLFNETFFNLKKSSINLLKATKTGIVALIDLFDQGAEANVSAFKELACKIVDDFHEVVKPSTSFRNTICHGDLWASNIMFQFKNGNPTNCCFVDFQSYRYAPPAQDLLTFIYFTTDQDFRKKYLDKVLAYYYERITEKLSVHNLNIETILPHKEFIESCNYYKPFAITQTLNHFPHILLTKAQIQDVDKMLGGIQKLLFEDKVDVILKMCSEDDTYRRRLYESIMDLKKVLIEQNLLIIEKDEL